MGNTDHIAGTSVDPNVKLPLERSANIDCLRAVAALYVLVVHASALSGALFPASDRTPWHLFVNTGAAGVWLFFALSGYLIGGPFITALVEGTPLPDVRSFALRRAARIWPAYVVALTTTILLVDPLDSFRRWQYPVHYLLVQNLVPGEFQAILSVSWTLSVEALFYVLVPVAALLLRRLRGPAPLRPGCLAVGISTVWLASVAFLLVADHHRPDSTGLYLRLVFPAMLGPFCPGMLAAVGVSAWRRSGRPPAPMRMILRWRRATVLVALLTSVLAALLTTDTTDLTTVDMTRELFAAAAGMVIVLAVSRRELTGRIGRLLAWLGVISYGIYLWHTVLEGIASRHGWSPLRNDGFGAFVVHVAFLLAVTVPVAALSWYVLERPIIRRAASVLRQSNAAREDRPAQDHPTGAAAAAPPLNGRG